MLLSGIFGSSNSTPPASNNNNANNNSSANNTAETEETSGASGSTQTGSNTETSSANSAQAASETSSETETGNGGSAQSPAAQASSGNGNSGALPPAASDNAVAKTAESAKPDALELARQAAQRVVDEAKTQALLSNIAPVAASAGGSSKSYVVSLLSPSGVAEAQINSPTPANAEPKSAKAK